jgi:hypothetical protein
MSTGYVRQDTANNIADQNIVEAADLDAEFDAIETAFDVSNGHTHDGTAAEGGPITKVGPAQEVLVDASSVYPATDDLIDIGKVGAEFKDGYFDGTLNADALAANTADIDGGTIDGTVIGGTTRAAGSFTTGNFNGALTATLGGSLTGTWSDLGTVTTMDLNGGTIDGTTIGATTRAAGS